MCAKHSFLTHINCYTLASLGANADRVIVGMEGLYKENAFEQPTTEIPQLTQEQSRKEK